MKALLAIELVLLPDFLLENLLELVGPHWEQIGK